MASLNYSSIEVRVGFFLAFCFALFISMLVTYGKISPMWRGRQEIHVVFENVNSLRPDAPVRYNGIEVGRVKDLSVLHLDDKSLERFPLFVKRDIDNLPLRPESLKRKLRDVSDIDFDTYCREALKNRTMIELCLEVLQDGDDRHFRLDDQIHIVSTILGDTAVEIISGNGTVNTSNSNLILGISGDFFSNLAKSMGDVKEILSGVTDVVGEQERRSFERAQARFGGIQNKVNEIAELVNRRSAETVKRMAAVDADIDTTVSRMNGVLENLRPRVEDTSDNIKTSFNGIEAQVNSARTNLSNAITEMEADMKPVRDDIKSALDQSRPDIEQMKKNIQSLTVCLAGLSEKSENIRELGGRLLYQSQPDWTRALGAWGNSFINFRYVKFAGNENKDLMISNRDRGEYEFNSAISIYRSLVVAIRRIREMNAQLQATQSQPFLSPEDQPSSFERLQPSSVGPSGSMGSSFDSISGRLADIIQQLDLVRNEAESKIYPEFERKKTAWQDDAPAKP